MSAGAADAAVVVVGSANVDQVYRVVAIPAPGETVLAVGSAAAQGGKGQNQAVAAARAGASTLFIAAIGADAFGASTLEGLSADGIDASLVRVTDVATGTALIAVDEHGENTIIVDAGANARLVGLTNDDISAISAASILVMQLEIPLATVIDAALAARNSGTTVILNAAPIMELPDELMSNVDILIVNEHEAASLASGGEARSLAPVVIVTLGAEGAVLYERGMPEVRVPAYRVSAVDATGAGDTFCGALAAAITEGQPLGSAVEFAVIAASLSVEAHGAVPSIPRRMSIDARMHAGELTHFGAE